MSNPDHSPVRLSPAGRALPACLTALALALGLAACNAAVQTTSSQSPSAQASPQPTLLPGQGVEFIGAVYVSTGTTQHISKPFTVLVKGARTCADAVQAAPTFTIPTAAAPAPQDAIVISGFRGPGTYPPAVLSHDKNDSIRLYGKPGAGQYQITAHVTGQAAGKEVLFLDKSGDGQLVYSNAHLDGKPGNPAIAGEIQWRCKVVK